MQAMGSLVPQLQEYLCLPPASSIDVQGSASLCLCPESVSSQSGGGGTRHMALPSSLLGMPKGTTGSLFVHPETLGQQPELSVTAGHMVTALLQKTHFRRNFSLESTSSQTTQKSPLPHLLQPWEPGILEQLHLKGHFAPCRRRETRTTPDLFNLLSQKHNFLLLGFPSNTAGNVLNFQ